MADPFLDRMRLPGNSLGFHLGGTDSQPKGQLRPLADTPVSTFSLSSLGKKHLSPISELGTMSALQEKKWQQNVG